MRIAVTYEDGNIFPHFGHTEAFKLYEVENGNVISCEVVSTKGTGHEALAYMLADMEVNVLICGGMGQGASDALMDAGIEVFSGASGNADDAVGAYLMGKLISSGVNCDHHDHEEENSCGSCGGCGGGCGGCHGCHSVPAIEGPNVGKIVKTHYRGTFNDGTLFDSSYDRNEPIEFICGAGMMIPGYDKAVATMEVGQKINIHLDPEEAYGPADPDAIFTIEIAQLPGAAGLKPGMHINLADNAGNLIPAIVVEKDDINITIDTNNEMAGKELNFEIELVEVK